MTPMIMNPFRFASVAASTEYASMYESRSELTTVQKQHFVEWFSGSALDSIWTQTGTGTFSMSDEADGGFNIYVSSVKASISFNNKRQYSETGSVYIGVGKIVLSNGADIGHYGFMDNTGTSTSSLNAFFEVGAATTHQYNTNNVRTSTSVSNDTNWHVLKSECKASSCEGTIDGTLRATRTASLPTAPQQPVFENRGAGGISNARIRYIEAYNT